MENVKMSVNLEEMEEKQKKPLVSKKTMYLLGSVGSYAIGCVAAYKMGAKRESKKMWATLNVMALVDPSFKDHFNKALETAYKAVTDN